MKYAAIALIVCVALLCVPTQADACGPAFCGAGTAFVQVGSPFVAVNVGPRFVSNAAFVSAGRNSAFVGGGFGGGATIINQQVNERRGIFGGLRSRNVSQQIINTR